MLMLISPAKTLDTSPNHRCLPQSTAAYLDSSAELIALLQKKSPQELAELMGISDKLARLNFERFQNWQRPFPAAEAKQALLMFMGDVYTGLDAASLDEQQLDYLQQHLCILSGLYGLLRPLDAILPYRLEMGSSLVNPKGKDLYSFWGSSLSEAIRSRQPPVVINLASNEYFKSLQAEKLGCPVITPIFEDWSQGKYRIISFHAKRARGLMVRWAAINNIRDPQRLKDFDLDGYVFAAEASDETHWHLRRRRE